MSDEQDNAQSSAPINEEPRSEEMQTTEIKPGTAPLSDIYPKGVGYAIFAAGVLAFLLFIVSAIAVAKYRISFPNRTIGLGAIWVVGVPLFFFFEHAVLFRKFGDQTQYEQFKRLQDLAAKIWAGAVLVLAALFTQTFPK